MLIRFKDLYRTTIVFLLFFTGIHRPACQAAEELRKEIEKLIRYDTEVSLQQVPGFIVGIIDGDSNEILAFGVNDLQSETPLHANDVFEIGSLTKVMTAHIILKLYENGQLDVDDQINRWLPEKYRNALFTGTIREVLLHHSGLPKLPETIGTTQLDMNNPYSGFTHEDLLTWYQNLNVVSPGQFRYSHTGYALLELIIENVTGDPYQKAFDRLISEAYGMQNTHAAHLSILTPGFDLAMRRAHAWGFQSFRASEGAVSTLSDLMTFARVLLADTETPLLWNAFESTGDKKLQIAPGWYRFLPKKNFPVYVHTGRTSGHSAMVAFSRKTNTAVVVLANSSLGTDDLGLLILRMINKQWRRKTMSKG